MMLGTINDQSAVSKYTGPVGGYSCNTAGGYAPCSIPGYLTNECMTASECASAIATANAPGGQAPALTLGTDAATGSTVIMPPANVPLTSQAVAPAVQGAVTTTNNPLTANGIVADASSVASGVPTWAWIAAAGVAALFFLKR